MGSQADELPSSSTTPSQPTMTSCRKKKDEQATFLEDLKDHLDEFVHASMDIEHKTCFQKTIKKMFGMSKVVAEKNSQTAEVESSLPHSNIINGRVRYLSRFCIDSLLNK